MTWRELRNQLNNVPDQFLDKQVHVHRIDVPGYPVEFNYFKEDWYWDGEDGETITPASTMAEMKKEYTENLTVLAYQMGEPCLSEEPEPDDKN